MLNLCLQNMKGFFYQNGIGFQHLSCICLSACHPCCKRLCLWTWLCTIGSNSELKVPPRLYQNQHHCWAVFCQRQTKTQSKQTEDCVAGQWETVERLDTSVYIFFWKQDTDHKIHIVHFFCPKIFQDSITGKKNSFSDP